MPRKRKALAETDGNQIAVAPPSKKATKVASTTKKAAKPRARKYVYSNQPGYELIFPNIATTYLTRQSRNPEPPPRYISVSWPTNESEKADDEGEEDKDPDMPKPGCTLTQAMIKKVSNMGYPISIDGIEKFEWMIQEQEKREQDMHHMYIYNDFSGYGCSEMIENFVCFHACLFSCTIELTVGEKACGFQQSPLQERCLALQEVGLP